MPNYAPAQGEMSSAVTAGGGHGRILTAAVQKSAEETRRIRSLYQIKGQKDFQGYGNSEGTPLSSFHYYLHAN